MNDAMHICILTNYTSKVVGAKLVILSSRHMIVCHAVKYRQCRCVTDKCVFYRHQENAISMAL